MNSKYKIQKYKSNNLNNVEDLISIEEPLEISIKFKTKETWTQNIISITMRTPGNDEDLVRGFLFNEKIIEKIKGSAENFMQSGSYLYLRSGMIERWNTLNKFSTYPKMLTPLKIN